MSKTYAYVVDNQLREIIPPASYEAPDEAMRDGIDPEVWDTLVARVGQDIPIEQRYTPEFVAMCVDITGMDPQPNPGDIYDGSKFAPYVAPAPSAAQILSTNTAARDAMLAAATLAIAPLQDAVDLDEATADETAKLKLWKQYRVAVNRIDLTQAVPVWPVVPT